MLNETLYKEFQQLERKIQLLVIENQKLKERLAFSDSQNESLKSKLDQHEGTIDHFRNQMKMSKIVNTIATSEGDSAMLKSTIDDYIKEIDKCIAHLAE